MHRRRGARRDSDDRGRGLVIGGCIARLLLLSDASELSVSTLNVA